MGLKWLDGKRWADITRDERWFCMCLYQRIMRRGVSDFVAYLRDRHKATVDAGANWELAFEACFYRDVWQYQDRPNDLYSPKRTFDLALMSDDMIIVLEAKAHGNFEGVQLELFREDETQIKRLTGIEEVLMIGICSSSCPIPEPVNQIFKAIVRWNELSTHFDGDEDLLRADAIYELHRSGSYAVNNSGGYMTGEELLMAFERKERFLVGRNGGLNGALFAMDIESGGWATTPYQTNRDATSPPNRNWFSLEKFVDCVRRDAMK